MDSNQEITNIDDKINNTSSEIKNDTSDEECNTISPDILQKLNNVNDPFWYDDYKILFYKERLTSFFPTMNMTFIEKLNSIFRMSIYLSIILYLVTSNYLYLYIMIIVGGFTVFIYYNQRQNLEMYFNSSKNSDQNSIQKDIIDKQNVSRILDITPFPDVRRFNVVWKDYLKSLHIWISKLCK